jgi:hypothetical protein
MSAVLVPAPSAQVGGLDRRAVGHGIGEGHAEFDHVRAARNDRVEQGRSGVRRGSPAVTKQTSADDPWQRQRKDARSQAHQMLGDSEDVLVATAAEIGENDQILGHRRRDFLDRGDGMAGFERE